MGKRRTLSQYRSLDLTLFAAMTVLFEFIIILASTRWFPGQPYTVSVVPAITVIVMVRWGPWAGIHAVLGGLVYCVGLGAEPRMFAIYCVGNAFSLLALPLLKRMGGGEGIRADAVKALTFGAAVLVLMQGGRALVSLAFGYAPEAAALFLTTEVITDLFTLVILWIVRRLDGVLEDQKHYILRVQEEDHTDS